MALPMGGKPAVQPNGLDGAVEATEDPGAAFGVFIIEHTPCAP